MMAKAGGQRVGGREGFGEEHTDGPGMKENDDWLGGMWGKKTERERTARGEHKKYFFLTQNCIQLIS